MKHRIFNAFYPIFKAGSFDYIRGYANLVELENPCKSCIKYVKEAWDDCGACADGNIIFENSICADYVRIAKLQEG